MGEHFSDKEFLPVVMNHCDHPEIVATKTRNPLKDSTLMPKSAICSLSKIFGQTGLFEHCVGRVPGFDVSIHYKHEPGDGAEPNFVVALAWPIIMASCFQQDFFKMQGIVGHQQPMR